MYCYYLSHNSKLVLSLQWNPHDSEHLSITCWVSYTFELPLQGEWREGWCVQCRPQCNYLYVQAAASRLWLDTAFAPPVPVLVFTVLLNLTCPLGLDGWLTPAGTQIAQWRKISEETNKHNQKLTPARGAAGCCLRPLYLMRHQAGRRRRRRMHRHFHGSGEPR